MLSGSRSGGSACSPVRFRSRQPKTVVAAAVTSTDAEVFDLVSRLVDKSLVVAEEDPDGEPRYRLLETCAPTPSTRPTPPASSPTLRDAHATWWTDWLEPRGDMPSDDILDGDRRVPRQSRTPPSNGAPAIRPLGLRLLRGVGRAWAGFGRAGDADGRRRSSAHRRERRAPRTAWLRPLPRSPMLVSDGPRMSPKATRCSSGSRTSLANAATTTTCAAARVGSAAQTPPDVELVRDVARERGDRYVEAVNDPARARRSRMTTRRRCAAARRRCHRLVATRAGVRMVDPRARLARADVAAVPRRPAHLHRAEHRVLEIRLCRCRTPMPSDISASLPCSRVTSRRCGSPSTRR